MKTQTDAEIAVSTSVGADAGAETGIGLSPGELPARLQIRLFGGFDLQQEGVPARRTRSRTETWLLAALLLHANRSVERSWLAGTFWPESRESQALNNLRRSLSNLRQVLGEDAYRLVSPTSRTVAFDLAGAFCDTVAFDLALARKDPASVRRAVSLYRGPLLPDCDADWLAGERSRRELAFLAALETLAELALRDGDTGEAVRVLQQVLRIDPFREKSQRGLLEALAARGDRAGMTLAYRQLRLRLHEELRSEPSAETAALYQRLQARDSRQAGASTPATSRPHPSDDSARLHLPWPLGELVGRESETQEVAMRLRAHRLVTLTGSGGIGKTRLALAAAAGMAADFPDGVWFVDLATVTDPAQVLPVIARTLERREHRNNKPLRDALRKELHGKRLLLLLDNAEHLRESCAEMTAALLETLPDLRALVTSRVALGVAGEQVWRVPSLAVPSSACLAAGALPSALLASSAPRLFASRARAASSSFILTEKNAPAVWQICARLDGIPLALELAAARVASLSPEQIAARLEDVFPLLTSGARTALPRHQTLQAMVDWSHTLLGEPEKALLRRLSVFRGGCTLEAAEEVCGFAPLEAGTVLDLLANLVDSSLVLADDSGGPTRYRMLETLRQFGRSKLRASGEEAEMHRRHRDFFLRLTEATRPKLSGAEQSYWLSVLESEHDNLRAAMATDQAVEAGGEAGLRIAAALAVFWDIRGYWSEGKDQLDLCLAHPGAQERTRVRARALNEAGMLAHYRGDPALARDRHLESRMIFQEIGDKDGIAGSLSCLGIIAREQGDYSSARRLCEESLEIERQTGNSGGIASCLNNLGNVLRLQGDFSAARVLYEESLALRRELGGKSAVGSSLNSLGNLFFDQGNYASAGALYEQSLQIFREVGNKNGIAYSLNLVAAVRCQQGDHASARDLYEASLAIFRGVGDKNGVGSSLSSQGLVAHKQGDLSLARRSFAEGLAIFQELGDKRSIVACLEKFACLTLDENRAERSVKLWAAATALREALGNPLSASGRQKQDTALAALRSLLGESACNAAWAVGCAMTLEQAAGFALEM